MWSFMYMTMDFTKYLWKMALNWSYGDWVRGSNPVILIFVSLFYGGQLLKEKTCSLRSEFFRLRVEGGWVGKRW